MKIVKASLPVPKIVITTLKKGGVVVFPTDTSYGLGVDATDIKAVSRLYKVKGRAFDKPVSVMVKSLKQAEKFLFFSENARKIFNSFLPGPLTLILPLRSKNLAFKKLSAGKNELGVRLPSNDIAIQLCSILGRPITATSANVSGQPDSYSVKNIVKQFSKKSIKPDLIIDAGILPKVKPSTVVAIMENSVTILRKGPISALSVRNILK